MISADDLHDLPDWTAGIAERKIQDAIEEGLLDNLPGKGRPLDLSVNPFEPPGMGAINRLLKHNKVLPIWVMLEQEIETSRAVALATLERWEASAPYLRETPDYARTRASARESYHGHMRHTNDLILKYNCSSPFSLRAPIPLMIKTRLREFDALHGVDDEAAP